jgi:hypothetical protein
MDVSVREAETPAFRTGDPGLFTETRHLTGREATVLTISPNEIQVRASILKGKGVLYRENAVLTVRPDQIRKLPWRGTGRIPGPGPPPAGNTGPPSLHGPEFSDDAERGRAGLRVNGGDMGEENVPRLDPRPPRPLA